MVNIQKIIVPNNYLYYMKLGVNDLKMMVMECVQRILEYHGAIDDRLMGLAELIIKRVKSGEDKFTLKRDELERYYPYKNVPESLNVSVQFLKPGSRVFTSNEHNQGFSECSLSFNKRVFYGGFNARANPFCEQQRRGRKP